MAPSPSAPPSSNKLLITTPNPNSTPKPGLPTASTNSASSSSTAATPPPDKKTRYQPNLSDCRCCARRINNTNPKDRLLLLDSVWRIVLLCRKCRRNVRSGETCPYCFQGTGNSGDFITCGVCQRKIHTDCVRIYGNSTPWRYLGVDSERCRVCVDCWVPELLKNSIRVSGSSENAGGSKEKGEDKDLMENAVKKVKSRGKERKNDALYLLSGSLSGSKAENLKLDDPVEALHKALNSSLGGKCFVNSNDSDVLSYTRSQLEKKFHEDMKLGEGDSCINSTGLNSGMQCYKRDKTRKIWHSVEENTLPSKSRLSLPEDSVHTNGDQNNVYRFQGEFVSYQRSKNKRKLFQVNNLVGGPELPQIDDAKLFFANESCASVRDRYCLKYGKRAKGFTPDSSFRCFSTLLNQTQASVNALKETESGFEKDGDRYLLKYEKRAAGAKHDSSFHIYSALLTENRDSTSALSISGVGGGLVSPGRYCFKYAKRVKSSGSSPICKTKPDYGGASLKGIEAEVTAAGLTINCFSESGTQSDVTLTR